MPGATLELACALVHGRCKRLSTLPHPSLACRCLLAYARRLMLGPPAPLASPSCCTPCPRGRCAGQAVCAWKPLHLLSLQELIATLCYAKGGSALEPRQALPAPRLLQNPTGCTILSERRRAVYRLCQRYGILLVEDDPYFFLQYPHGPGTHPS